ATRARTARARPRDATAGSGRRRSRTRIPRPRPRRPAPPARAVRTAPRTPCTPVAASVSSVFLPESARRRRRAGTTVRHAHLTLVGHRSNATRKPWLPEEESGVLLVRAATR